MQIGIQWQIITRSLRKKWPWFVVFSDFHDVHLQAAMWCQPVYKISENLVGVSILELSPEYHHSILVVYV